jgi:hypothetical protein
VRSGAGASARPASGLAAATVGKPAVNATAPSAVISSAGRPARGDRSISFSSSS